MKEQYMTLVTPLNVAITMAEQSNDVGALLQAIELKLNVLAIAEDADPMECIGGERVIDRVIDRYRFA